MPMDVKGQVSKLIHRYGTSDPLELAKCLNIKVLSGDLGGLYGNYYKYLRDRIIFIDYDRTPPEMVPFVCAHELGHALFTPDANTEWLKTYTLSVNADQVEYIANQFAVELLLNDDFIADHEGISLYNLAECAGVPKKFISLKK